MGLAFEVDNGAASQALGLIVLQSDETLEAEYQCLQKDSGVVCYHARIPSHPLVTNETLATMEADLPRTAALLPDQIKFGAIGYGCTSGATVIGQQNVARAVQTHHAGAKVTDPITAVMAALRSLGLRKIGLLTPYLPEVTAEMQALLVREGFEIARLGSFEQSEDRKIARIAEPSVLAAIEEIGSDPEVEGVFASCTNLRTFSILQEAERRIGKPVVSSNQALFWHMGQLSGAGDQIKGPGRLFEQH